MAVFFMFNPLNSVLLVEKIRQLSYNMILIICVHLYKIHIYGFDYHIVLFDISYYFSFFSSENENSQK
tara:strand:+ start:104504 stop:104707 length:204 start_codon:yes stop_codon:yes gene_type:complete